MSDEFGAGHPSIAGVQSVRTESHWRLCEEVQPKSGLQRDVAAMVTAEGVSWNDVQPIEGGPRGSAVFEEMGSWNACRGRTSARKWNSCGDIEMNGLMSGSISDAIEKGDSDHAKTGQIAFLLRSRKQVGKAPQHQAIIAPIAVSLYDTRQWQYSILPSQFSLVIHYIPSLSNVHQ